MPSAAKPIHARELTGVIRHRLFPTCIVGESDHGYFELLGDEGYQFFWKPGGALRNLSEGDARVAKQRKLKGNAEAIAVFPPQPDLIDVARLKRVEPDQVITVDRDPQQLFPARLRSAVRACELAVLPASINGFASSWKDWNKETSGSLRQKFFAQIRRTG